MPYHICGGKPLCGSVMIQGSKNGALPLLAATLLIKGKTVLHHCPCITDVDAMLTILEKVGCEIKRCQDTVIVDASQVSSVECPQEQVKAMRSSVMLLGPLLARCGHACMESPGGCMIGKRPIDIHIQALEKMKVSFQSAEALIVATSDKICGAHICLPFPSVGATENVIMTAVLAEGTTVLEHAAMEPEVTALCEFLVCAGARISGIGNQRLCIEGLGKQKGLQEIEYWVMPDRIVAGTYLFGAAVTRGQVCIHKAPVWQLGSVLRVLRQMGCEIVVESDTIWIDAMSASGAVPFVRTDIYPGFPTDLQSMLTVCLAHAEGESIVEETIFENRFQIVEQLIRLGAHIKKQGKRISIIGTPVFYGSQLEALELRGGAALVLAALAAKGESVVTGTAYIERGYEDIVRDIRLLGGEIERI